MRGSLLQGVAGLKAFLIHICVSGSDRTRFLAGQQTSHKTPPGRTPGSSTSGSVIWYGRRKAVIRMRVFSPGPAGLDVRMNIHYHVGSGQASVQLTVLRIVGAPL